jgi:penicillin V acylase-like amidase (Ntn superfamily)
MMDNSLKVLGAATVALLASLGALHPLEACTRAVYLGSDGLVITGRSMDWAEDMRSNLWVFPRGMERDGATGRNSPTWTSKYGSLIVAGYDLGTADGMNEKGLVANLLYLADSDYGKPDGKPSLSISVWAQYALDNFAMPLGMSSPGQPNVSSTLWRTVSDQKNRVYYFDSATSPNAFWVPLADLDFSEGAPVKKLTIAGGKVYSGNAADKFEPAEPFTFLPYSS